MDAIELLRGQTKKAWEWLETTIDDVTEEQANWQPSGTANPIGANYAHLLITADAGFNTQLLGGMPDGYEVQGSDRPQRDASCGRWLA